MDSPTVLRQNAEPSYVTEELGGVYMLGVNLSTKSKCFQLSYCTAGVFFGFMINGVCEEYVFKGIDFNFAWYVTLLQSLTYLLLARLHGFRPQQRRQRWSAYVALASVLVGSMGLTKASLLYLNYPAQIMFKSSKVLPVMLLGSFMPGFHRRYSRHEYTSALLLVGGLVVFTLSDASATPSFHPAGVAMILAALVCDAFLGNLQEAIFSKDPETSQTEVLFCSTLAGLAFLAPPLLLTGELWTAWKRGLEVPMTYVLLALTAGATYVGQLAILSLINLFGAATTYVAHSYAKVPNSPILGVGDDPKEVGKGDEVNELLPEYDPVSRYWRGGGVAAGTSERMGGGEGEGAGVIDDVVVDLAKIFSGMTNGEAKLSPRLVSPRL